jgi:RND family efflux transporter MFP subunit
MTTHKFIKFTGLMLVTGLILAGCSANSNKSAPTDTLELPVVTLKTKDTSLQAAYVADIQAVKNVEIRARVRGFLEKIYIDEGMAVKQGQLLFKLNDQDFRVALSSAKAALSNAVADAEATELEIERVKMLVNKKVIAKSELDVAKTKLVANKASIEQARSQVTNAQNHLAYTSIRAPFSGIVDRIPLKAGSLIDEGTLLTSLSDISSMFAYFSFPENEYLNYKRKLEHNGDETGRQVKLVLSDGSSYPYPGKIETVEGQIEQSTGSIDFRARFPNPEKLLRHGASGKLYLSSAAKQALLVPQQAVFDIQDKSYVYVVDQNNKLHMKSFTPLTRLSHYYVVKDGLKAGDRILFEGAQNARDGMVIKPKKVLNTSMLAMRK